MTPQEALLAAIRARQEKNTLFNEGILTADRWVQSVQDCVGSDMCYRFAARKNMSFNDAIKRAKRTLTYNNPEMVKQELLKFNNGSLEYNGKTIQVPRHTLMVVRHVLTTPKKDRDGDILRTQGAQVDPKMLLLWNHVHTLPIGKALMIAEHNSKMLSMISAIVDVNDLAHDAAVMVDSDMGRFSHGFRALEFSDLKETEGSGRTSGKGGFDVKKFEVMEESLVTVPSNTDAEQQEVLLSLVEGGKLTSPMMKEYGKTIRKSAKKKQFALGGIDAAKIPINLDLNITLNGNPLGSEEEDEDGHKATKCSGKEGCSCGCTSEKTDDGAEHEGDKAKDTEVECPKCGKPMVKGHCKACGYSMKDDDKEVDQEHADANNDMGSILCPKCGITAMVDGKCPECGYAEKKEVKTGRVLSAKNMASIVSVRGSLQDISDREYLLSDRGKSHCSNSMKALDEVLASAQPYIETQTEVITAKQAMAIFLAEATPEEWVKMVDSIKALHEIQVKTKKGEKFRVFTGRG